MAPPKIAKDWTSAGMGMLVAAGLTFASIANDADKAFAGEKKTAKTEHVWNAENLELHKAATGARDYAENNVGVGILIHVGKDVPNSKVKSADQLGQIFVNRFKALGVNAKYFLRQNDTEASGITYHIGHQIHGAEDGTEVKLLREAWDSAPDVVKQLKVVKQLAAANAPVPKGS